MRCEYWDCKRKAKKIIRTTMNNKPHLLKVCKKCYKEYKKA